MKGLKGREESSWYKELSRVGLRIHSELQKELPFEGQLFQLSYFLLDLLTVSLTVYPYGSPHMKTASLKRRAMVTSTGLLLLRQLCKVILGFNFYSPTLLTLPLTLATWSVFTFIYTLNKATLGEMGCSFSFLNNLQEDPAIPQLSRLQLQRTNVHFQNGSGMVRAVVSTQKATYRISQTSGPNLSLLNPTILNILWTFDAWDNCNKCCMILKVCKCQQSS